MKIDQVRRQLNERFHRFMRNVVPYLFPRSFFALLIALLMVVSSSIHAQSQLSAGELERIGKRIWQNETAGSVEGLTSWNSGEDFASLGIGHFIWYPAGKDGPFEESFPQLIAYFSQAGVQVPQWLLQTSDCPWSTREAFIRDKNSQHQQDLRRLLSATVKEQTQFIIARLNAARPKLQAAAGNAAGMMTNNMRLLGQTAAGNFAMIDYVNFKGEGLKPEERYNGQGWGLLQVLIEMGPVSSANQAPAAFAEASKAVLTRRVKNSPPARNEKQWLQGWLNRCDSYRR